MDTNDYVSAILSYYHRKARGKESLDMGDIRVTGNTFEFIGQMPLWIPIVQKLRIRDIVDSFCPMERHNPQGLTHGEVFESLVYNRLSSPRPMYKVEKWAAENSFNALFGIDPGKLNDDRIARTLDMVAHKTDEIQGALSLKMMEEFGISPDTVHYDITSLSFEGNYEESEIVKFGYSRDKRPDLKQVNLSLDVTRDGAIPLWSSILEGNMSDVKTVVNNMKNLQKHIKIKDYVTIMDRGMVSGDNIHSLMDKGVGFVTAIPLKGKTVELILDTDDEDYSSIEYTDRSGEDNIQATRCFVEFRTNKVKRGRSKIFFRVPGYIYHSSRKRKRDRTAREKGIGKIVEILDDISAKLNTRKYKNRDYVVTQIEKKIGRKKARSLFRWELTGNDGELNFKYWLDEESLKRAEALDGKYILATDDENRSADDVLKSYKSQYSVEWRFRHLKSNLRVSPLFLKKDIRIIALVFVTIIALMVYSLLEYLCQKAKLKQTAFILTRSFGVCIFSRLRFSNGASLYVAADPSPFQKWVLDSLGFPYPREYI